MATARCLARHFPDGIRSRLCVRDPPRPRTTSWSPGRRPSAPWACRARRTRC